MDFLTTDLRSLLIGLAGSTALAAGDAGRGTTAALRRNSMTVTVTLPPR